MTAPVRARSFARTGFSDALDQLLERVPEALCATFIDSEGETVDTATRVDVFDARVAGAVMALPLASAKSVSRALGLGALVELRVLGVQRALWARHIGGDTDLVMLLDGGSVSARTASLGAAAAAALRVEAGIDPTRAQQVLRSVELRTDPEGRPLPTAFDHDGRRQRVSAVLGIASEGEETLFLVRTDRGEECVVRRGADGRWHRES